MLYRLTPIASAQRRTSRDSYAGRWRPCAWRAYDPESLDVDDAFPSASARRAAPGHPVELTTPAGGR